ncbi:hypothetical protein CVT24_001552 [Panaeolus cyanescens]|uniref:Uncharacterized protein n=1 Tax=Panaeolus cyanescens TaxID=181874 RepID=A0A409YU73_9AGAR|nr:hypothetical protein CVT24_001552 [Panaeolus cyanescens]
MINIRLKALFAHELRQAKKRRNQSLSLLLLRFNQKRPHNIHFERLEPHLLHPTTPFDHQIPPQLQPRSQSPSIVIPHRSAIRNSRLALPTNSSIFPSLLLLEIS